MLYLITKWFGVFLHDGRRIVKFIIFPKDEKEIAERIWKIKEGKILDEEREIVKGKENVVTGDSRLSEVANYQPSLFKEISLKAKSFGFDEDILRKASIILAEKEVSRDLGREDLQVIEMVRILDQLFQFSNILSEKIRDWKKLTYQDSSIEDIINLKDEMDRCIELLEERIEEKMKKIAPNLSEIAGALLGARLITLAGGLDKLATMPASAIQIIGAEKALFRYKAGEGTPPKHGIIYQHPLIRRSKVKVRGKIARVISNTITTAVKADAFTKRIIADELRKRMEEKLREKNLI